MDDLYNNAWGDPVNPETASTSFGSSQPSWTSPKLSHDLHDDESDLAAPSWSTGTGIKWNEPSEDDHGFAWSHTEPDLAWTSSTYETIQIGKLQSTHALEEPSSPDADEREIEVTPHQSPRLDQEPLRVQEETTPREEFKSPSKPPISPVQSPTPSRSPSPDGFGTFTSGFVAADDAVSPDPAFQLGDDSWGSAWAGDVGSEAEEKAEVEDEWDVAKRRKEQQDRVVVRV